MIGRCLFLIMIFVVVAVSLARSQNEMLDLLNKSLLELQEDSRKLVNENEDLKIEINRLTRENSRLKFENKNAKENNKKIQELLDKLYLNQSALDLKVIEANILRRQVDILELENNDLGGQVKLLNDTKMSLEEELNSTKLKLEELDSVYNEKLRVARLRAVKNNLMYPFGRPNPSKFQITPYFGISLSTGMIGSIERKSTQYGIGIGYDSYNSQSSSDISFVHTTFSFRQYFPGDSLKQ